MTRVPLRSYLYAPGNSDKLLRKVFDAGADAVVLDLEDAVPPTEKEAARLAVRAALATRPASPTPETWVRINALDGPLWQADIDAVVLPALTGVRIPKAESTERLADLDRQLERAEAAAGIATGTVAVAGIIESAAGLLAAEALARSPRMVQLAFGGTDFTADVGADPTDGDATLFARSFLVTVSRATGIAPPIAPVWTDLADDAGLRDSATQARRLGFFGQSIIHPKQTATVHAVFTPSPEEVAEARSVLAAWQQAESQGSATTVTATGGFVDPAVVRHARSVVQLAERIASRQPAGVEV